MENDIFKSARWMKLLLSPSWRYHYLLNFNKNANAGQILTAGYVTGSNGSGLELEAYHLMVSLLENEDVPQGLQFNGLGSICLGWGSSEFSYITALIMHWACYNKIPDVSIERVFHNVEAYELDIRKRGWLDRGRPPFYDVQTGISNVNVRLLPGDGKQLLRWRIKSPELESFLQAFIPNQGASFRFEKDREVLDIVFA